MGSKSGLAITRSQLDAGRKRIVAALKTATLEDLSQKIAQDIAALLGAGSVRLYLRDPLTEELYTRILQGKRLREHRVAADPSSVVGYAAMTRKKSFAWKRDAEGVKRYVVAVPILVSGDLAGVFELTHGTKDAVVDEERLKSFYDLFLSVGRPRQEIREGPVRATPYDYLLQSGMVTRDALRKAREQAA